MEPGTLLAGRYRIDAALASGGMGVVYSAKQLPLGRPVAVKVLKRELLKHGPFLARLRREAHTAAGLKHPNIVDVTDLVLEDELAFLVMELLEGESLGSLIGRAPSLSGAVVATIGRQVLNALDAAHAAGLVHRDVKPDNIFLVRGKRDGAISDDTVKLLDFGLVKTNEDGDVGRLTATNAVLGTWQYMAPEQARGEEADPRADLYSLGAVLYYALTKKRPYQAADMEASMFALSEAKAPPVATLRPDVSAALCAIVERALDKDLLRRFQSAREMLDALAGLSQDADSAPATAPADGVRPRMRAAREPSVELISVENTGTNSNERLAAISRAIDAVVGPTTVDDESNASRADIPSHELRMDTETLPRLTAADAATSAPIVLDPGGREAYASTFEASPAETEVLPSRDLVSEIESVELHSVAPSRKQWRPPQKVRQRPLEDWTSGDAFGSAGKRTRFRKIGLFVAIGLLVFASGIVAGEVLFR